MQSKIKSNAISLSDGEEPEYSTQERPEFSIGNKVGIKNLWIRSLYGLTDKKSWDFDAYLGFGYYTKGLFWFRFKHNNKGFHIKNTKLHMPTFSERMNIKGHGFNIGNWHFKWLKRYEG